MLSYTLYGVADWAARVPSAVFATGMVAGVFVTVRRIRHNARLDAALMVASSALVLGFARAASTDMLLTAPFAVALLCWFCWYQAEYAENGDAAAATRHPRVYLALFFICAALATLAKGPVAPGLAGLVLIAFCLVERNPKAILRTLDPVGIALFLLVAAPWFVMVQHRTPEFFRVFFLQHNLARFGSNLYRHHQPFWYYIPVALAAALPWTVWLFPAVAEAWRALRRRLKGESDPGASCAFEVFLFVWAAVPIVFFSLSHSKLPGYILPAMPALLILAAVGFHRSAEQSQRPHWLGICFHAALLSSLVAALCLSPKLLFKLPATPQQLVIAAVAAPSRFWWWHCRCSSPDGACCALSPCCRCC